MPRKAAPLLAALVLCARADGAAACLDLGTPCGDLEYFTGAFAPHTEHIPLDGVLPIEFTGPAGPTVTPAQVDLQVTLDGMPVAGALEDIGVAGVLAWRPAEQFVPLAKYLVEGTLDNGPIPPEAEFCADAQVPFEFEFTVAAAAAPPLVQPAVGVDEELVDTVEQSLYNFVCCDGAFPFWQSSGCGGGHPDVEFQTGFCAPLTLLRRLHVALTITLTLPPDSPPMVTATLVVDGEPEPARLFLGPVLDLQAQASEPLCTKVVLRDLATGATVTTPEQCHGQTVADQLGMQALEPDAPALAEACKGAPYTCEVLQHDAAWDPERCTPWPAADETTTTPTTGADASTGTTSTTGTTGTTAPGQGGLVDHGCACNSGPPAPTGALLALCALAWRRRARRPA